MVSMEPTKGHEQRGHRPVIVLSATAFNARLGLPMVCPITNGGNFARTAGFAVALQGFGLVTTGVVRCDQIRALDIAARAGRLVEAAPPPVVAECLVIVQAIFS